MDPLLKFSIHALLFSFIAGSVMVMVISCIDSWKFARIEYDYSRVDKKFEQNGKFFFQTQIWYNEVMLEVDEETYGKFQESHYMQVSYEVTRFWHKVRNARMIPYDAPLLDFAAGLHSDQQVPQVLH